MRLLSVLMVLVIALGLVSPVCAAGFDYDPFAHSSNKNEVRSSLASGNWIIVYGKTIEEGDWAVAAACTYFGCIGAYFEYYIDETINKIRSAMPNVGAEVIRQLIQAAFQQKGRIFQHLRLQIKAGNATYNRWKKVSMKVPNGSERYKIRGPWGTWTWGWRPTTRLEERLIPLPNHHQLYFGFRFLN